MWISTLLSAISVLASTNRPTKHSPVTSLTLTGSSQQLPALVTKLGVWICNTGDATVYVNFGAAATSAHVQILVGTDRLIPVANQNEIRVIGTATKTLAYWAA